jgi:hypothetical protein
VPLLLPPPGLWIALSGSARATQLWGHRWGQRTSVAPSSVLTEEFFPAITAIGRLGMRLVGPVDEVGIHWFVESSTNSLISQYVQTLAVILLLTSCRSSCLHSAQATTTLRGIQT